MTQNAHSLNLRIVGFIALPDKMVMSAYMTVQGQEKFCYAYVPSVDEKAKATAEERGVALGDIADDWNELLNQEEAAKQRATGFPTLEATTTLSEEAAAYLREFDEGFIRGLEETFKNAPEGIVIATSP